MRIRFLGFLLLALLSLVAFAQNAEFKLYAAEDEAQILNLDSPNSEKALKILLQTSEGGYRDVLGEIDLGSFKKHFFITRNNPPQLYFRYKDAAELASLQDFVAHKKIWGRTETYFADKYDRKVSKEMYFSLPPTEGKGYLSVTLKPQKLGKASTSKEMLSPAERIKNLLTNMAGAGFKPEFKFYYVLREQLTRGEDLADESRLIPYHKAPQEKGETAQKIDVYQEVDQAFEKLRIPQTKEKTLHTPIAAQMTLPLGDGLEVKVPLLIEHSPNTLVLHFFNEENDRIRDQISHKMRAIGGNFAYRSAEKNQSLLGMPRPSFELSLQINAYHADLARFLDVSSERLIGPERMTADFLSLLHRDFNLEFASKEFLDASQLSFVRSPKKAQSLSDANCIKGWSTLAPK